MIKALILSISVLTLSACNQTTKEDETISNEKPQMAKQVVTQSENKPSAAEKILSETSARIAQIDQTELTKETLKTLRKQVSKIEENNACDTDAQCKVIETGSRACGGPSHYMIYSTKNTSEQKAKKLSQKLTHYESRYNAQNRMISICEMLTKPKTQCINNECIKLSNGVQNTH